MKTSRIIYFIFIGGLFLVSCESNEQKLDPLNLCCEFYELNKDAKFDGLYNVHILGIRERSEFNDSILKYHRITPIIEIKDFVSDTNILLPSFSRNADRGERHLFFARCNLSCIMYLMNKYNIQSTDRIFDFYVKEIESIYSDYYQIKVPEILPYANIELNGNGNYIKFVLYKNDEKRVKYQCYYVKDTIFSNDNMKDYFDKLPKFDDHWYYEIEKVGDSITLLK